uniref:Apoptotic peptidase activating factor 1 n=1 Tax=Neogobius melanostomus TaxID=47308 RepID=A0A8C6UJV2_9GOBI
MALDEGPRSCLLRVRHRLEQDMKPSYIMDHMITDGVLTVDEEEKIRTRATRKDQAAALLELMLRKDNRTYISFYNALIKETYDDLASLLHADLPRTSPTAYKSFPDGYTPYVRTVLSEGGVPQRPVVFVSRPELLNRVREKLYQLQKEPGWVTIFGMAGSGKSVLAAEAARYHSLIEECFPGGIHWLSIGQLDKPDLLVKIQSLCFRLEQELDPQLHHRPPNSLDEAKERMRFLMLRRYPRSLLILDDIWDTSVLKAFDIQCRILLTTRNRSLVDSVSGAKYEVEVASGLDEKKGLEILALYTNRKMHGLPEEARSIVKECKGSPLVVSLIGALLKEKPDRWHYYLRQLQQKQFKRIRKSSSYDYDALDQAMAASIEVLPEEHRELYKDFTVLEKDIKVPAKVLSILWDLPIEEVEDILEEFANKSLLFMDTNNKPYLYYLHDLQLDFLIEQNRNEIEVKMHVMLNYFLFSLYHMDPFWIKKLVSDRVLSYFIFQNSDVRSQFQEFLSLNGHQLEHRPDVVQLALSEPLTSEVYRQARMQALQQSSRGKLFFDWLNKNCVENLSLLVIHPHQGSLYSACFSHDGSKIASCGASKSLKMFKSTSGEKLMELQAHDDEVLCCAFSPDDHLIATCSSDRKVKVWNVERAMIIRVFEEEHEEQINHCQFTNTTRRLLLATCSNDKFLNVKNTMFGHFEPVNHCCFSPDDAIISTCSNDGTVKVILNHQTSSANEWQTINVKDLFEGDEEVLVKCSTWTADGKRIACAARNGVWVRLVCVRTNRLSMVQYCQACPTSNLLAIAYSNYGVELWDLESNKKMADCSGHLSWVQRLQFSPDGSQLLSCSDDQTVRVTVHDGRKGQLLFQSEEMSSRIRCTCLSRQLSAVAFGQDDGTVQVLEVPSGKLLASLKGHTKTVFHCQFIENGQTLLTSSEDATIRVWSWQSGDCKVLQGHKEQVRCFSLLSNLPTESTLLSWSFDGTVKVWDVKSGQKLQDIDAHRGAILSCHVSPDRSLFTTTSADKTAKVWHCETWDCVHTLKGHSECVRSCMFSWDGRRIATGDDNGEIRICSREGKDGMDSLHGGWVTDLHFSPDNSLLVSTGGYIKWWDVERGEALQTFYPKGLALKKIHVSPDFSTFVTVDNIGILYILKRVTP